MLTISGRRPVQVVGYELPQDPKGFALGHTGGLAAGIEMITLDNGAVAKSIHGD